MSQSPDGVGLLSHLLSLSPEIWRHKTRPPLCWTRERWCYFFVGCRSQSMF